MKMGTRRKKAAVETELESLSEARSSCHSGSESSMESSHSRTRLVKHVATQHLGQFLHLLPLTVLMTQHGGAISNRNTWPISVYFGD